MQAANQRILNQLSSKVHSQLPLSPRESQQLLNLLTTSFRTHLDREHPLASDASSDRQSARKPKRLRADDSTNGPPMSSHSSANQHMNSILTNPLFAIQNAHASNSRRTHGKAVLQDPVGWFLDQAALGAADFNAARRCIFILATLSDSISPAGSTVSKKRERPATQVASYMKSTGMDTSSELFASETFISQIAPLLIKEGSEGILWHWFARKPPTESVIITKIPSIPSIFQSLVLREMVNSKLENGSSLTEVLGDFLRAHEHLKRHNIDPRSILRRAAQVLTKYICAHSQSSSDPNVFNSFIASAKVWGGQWTVPIQSTLWLHHPSHPSADMAFAFIQHPNRPSNESLSEAQTKLFVHMYLETARQLLADQKFADAHQVLQITMKRFPDAVGAKPNQRANPSKPDPVHEKHTPKKESRKKSTQESRNLEMLDRLLPI
ncbi:hypothetical protein B0J11DRAFT_41790 [Dendryphion nanum]|uniref:Uncharacterized protein n=1 Tax=Dendryphion nanum TaxID=256645 RepID=A0A9P9ELT5_9PLEO|nr:hypothetical protein B0J11DRAFT_41790 [Dendryphion nanum]